MSANQVLGFILFWGAVFVLGYLNAKTPAPDPSVPVVGTGGPDRSAGRLPAPWTGVDMEVPGGLNRGC